MFWLIVGGLFVLYGCAIILGAPVPELRLVAGFTFLAYGGLLISDYRAELERKIRGE